MDTPNKFCTLAEAVIRTEAQAVLDLLPRINELFSKACDILFSCEGRIVVLGMGKSGHIGSKIAATLASTGSPAFYVHPAEASHGDLGMITTKDVVLAISNSGETPEIITLLPIIKRLKVPLITLTGNTNSTLAKASHVNIDVSVKEEACPLGLAPTSSTTATLVMGDALAISLLEARGFTQEDFAFSHPGGSLGRRLLIRIEDIMHTGKALPMVYTHSSVSQALMEMTQKGLGMTAVLDKNEQLCGIFTDGDLRRAIDKGVNVHTTTLLDTMTPNGKTIQPGMLAADALQIMEDFKITSLLVVNEEKQLLGAIHLHDILRAGIS